MKVYLRNIKAILKIYKDGRWINGKGIKGKISVCKYIFKYTVKYIITNK